GSRLRDAQSAAKRKSAIGRTRAALRTYPPMLADARSQEAEQLHVGVVALDRRDAELLASTFRAPLALRGFVRVLVRIQAKEDLERHAHEIEHLGMRLELLCSRTRTDVAEPLSDRLEIVRKARIRIDELGDGKPELAHILGDQIAIRDVPMHDP